MTTSDEELFHGTFIPNDPHPLPLPVRLLIGVGLGVGILIILMLSVNVLNSWGVWVTLLLVSVITAGALLLWIRDALKHPATTFDEDGKP
jgi:hypothetical protein